MSCHEISLKKEIHLFMIYLHKFKGVMSIFLNMGSLGHLI